MQIKGEEFIKKVQLQQEREELERKLSELEEVEVSIGNINLNNNLNMNNDSINLNRNTQFEPNEHELDNIMLGTSSIGSNEENKKKYLILGIVLVVLFLLTIIIIRLLTNDPAKEDQFTSNNANSSEIKKLSENSNIEENFQKIINERVKKDTNEPMIPENAIQADQRLQNLQQTNDNTTQEERETIQEEAPANISNETLDETIKKIEEKKATQKEKVVQTTEKKAPQTKEVTQNVEQKKSVRDLMDSPSSSSTTSSTSMSSGYFVQIGAFTKKPTDGYINTIRNAKFKYKIYQQEIKGVTYNKVLIGPYSSKAAASESVEDIKEKLNVTSAFVVKF
ncbi:SPOR domain-containing protein [Arcobacter ellisii]|uniref:SPOR domain-containing protein n=1 Tax=Arcobacter ellisii TaxID=913109 RepID=A0A347U6N4_9BACT|nr:SPOR domain-containing protein [Arcobacter ellisii]AXX94512.1 SPOR domain-containing protein [Arcobacter ellisii]RXI31209.1 SPOR domain-containing protein [Arcobacter ellisii]